MLQILHDDKQMTLYKHQTTYCQIVCDSLRCLLRRSTKTGLSTNILITHRKFHTYGYKKKFVTGPRTILAHAEIFVDYSRNDGK